MGVGGGVEQIPAGRDRTQTVGIELRGWGQDVEGGQISGWGRNYMGRNWRLGGSISVGDGTQTGRETGMKELEEGCAPRGKEG